MSETSNTSPVQFQPPSATEPKTSAAPPPPAATASPSPTQTPPPSPPPNPHPLDANSAFTAAYERRLSAIMAVEEHELANLNVDPHAVITTVLGALTELNALRASIGALPGIDYSLIEGLEHYARAAGEAHSRYVTATLPGEDIAALNDEASAMRDTFRSDATALANRGLIDPARLSSFKNLSGYKNVAFDLIDYANLMRDCWPQVQGRTAILPEEVQKAKELGERLVLAAGQREQGPAVVVETARIRQQALSLLLKAYEETRRAVTFLRWHADDIDVIAPSLYAGRGGRPKTPTPPAVAPAQPVPAPVVAAPVAPANGHPATPIAPGMPGASPFVN